jgi:hypothetical protein
VLGHVVFTGVCVVHPRRVLDTPWLLRARRVV